MSCFTSTLRHPTRERDEVYDRGKDISDKDAEAVRQGKAEH